MAQINIKHKMRRRVQITISEVVWQKYDANLKYAQSLGVEIDYTVDFETWLKRQNDEVQKKLAEMSNPVSVPAPTSAPVASKVHVATATPEKNTVLTGGNRNGND